MFLKLHPLAKDLSVRKFGRLQPLGAVRHEKDKSGRKLIVWLCRCDCGNDIETRSCNLLNGDTQSCGCLSKDVIVARNTKHGRSGSKTYLVWAGMVQRCEQKTASNYAYYGGRGIKVCARWRNDFTCFLEDMGECPPKHSLDRIDCNGDYEPGNCRWATHKEQMSNTRRNVYITINGETLHANEWCRRVGIKQGTLWDRINRGWPPERAVLEPVHRR